MVEVRNLVVDYGPVRAVHGVDFAVQEGEFLTLLGPSGCGKTTTLRCIAGLERPSAGEIEIAGALVSAPARGVFVAPDQRRIGMVFQSYAIWPHMTVFNNVAFPLESQRLGKGEIRRRVGEVLELLGLQEMAGRSATKLSGGQQQRVALARALVLNPRLLLLDEPLSNLDAKLRESTRFELKRLQRQIGLTTIYVTHDQAEAIELSDRILVLSKGRIDQAGAPRAVYDEPATPFVADFIGQANFVKGTLEAAADPGHWLLRTQAGARLTVSYAGGQAGQAVILALRPHRLLLHPADAGAAGVNAMPGQVVRATYVGDRQDCLVQVEGVGEVRVYAPPEADLASGQRVVLSFRPEHGRVMPEVQGEGPT